MSKIKKGTITTLQTIIIILLVFLALLIFVMKFTDLFKAKSDREVCRLSVTAQSVAMTAAPSGEDVFTPDCKTYGVVFYNDHVESNKKTISVWDQRKQKPVVKFSGLTDDIVNQVVAEELRGCWYQFLEGRRKVFTRGSNWVFVNIPGKIPAPRLCFICDDISFNSGVKQDSFTKFYQYTQENNMKGADITYYQYYAEEPRICESSGYDVVCWQKYFEEEIAKPTGWKFPEDTSFQRGLNYAVVFIKRGLEGYALGSLWANKENYFAYVLPADAIGETCNDVMRGSPT